MRSPARLFVLALALVGASACSEQATPVAPAPDSRPALAAAASPGVHRLEAVSTGRAHACAISMAGAAYCWGANAQGQLGDGTRTPSPVPVAVGGSLAFREIHAADDYTCGVTRRGEIHCWGTNNFGQFGDGTTAGSLTPVPAAGGLQASSFSAGNFHACAVDRAGDAYCWGANGAVGVAGFALGAASDEHCDNLGNPTYRGAVWPCSTTPVRVSGGLRLTSVSAGLWYTCGVAEGGTGYCWGWNVLGQLGTGTTVGGSQTPTAVAGGHAFRQVEAGGAHACALAEGGEAYCWGGGPFAYGQLGNGSLAGSRAPVAVAGGVRFATLSPSSGNSVFMSTCATTAGGEAYCWGSDRGGELGSGGPMESCGGAASFPCSSRPLAVEGGARFRQVSAGTALACGVSRDGRAYCWGDNAGRELGATTGGSGVPTAVPSP